MVGRHLQRLLSLAVCSYGLLLALTTGEPGEGGGALSGYLL